MGFSFPHLDRFYIGKRLGILLGITFAVASGYLIPQEQLKVSAYYSSFAEMAVPLSITPTIPPPIKQHFAVLSAEVVESIVPSPTPTPIKSGPTPSQSEQTTQYGKAKQIDEHTWTIDVGDDGKNASAQEIYTALNTYRKQKGKGELSWDSKLGDYAQGRASGFSGNNKLDSHAGFQDFINNQDGFTKLGFFALGENSSIGYNLTGTHLIEWVYAGDQPHDDNQLSSDWTHVGVGVSGDATNLIFGGRKQ